MKTSAQRVIDATNSWLHAQTRRSQHADDKDSGYVCTLSVLVLKAATAHIFHVGDSRIYRVAGNALEQLTDDHRVVLSSEQIYLSRALGMSPQVEIDYRTLQLEEGDVFVLATDGVYEHRRRRRSSPTPSRANADDLDGAASAIVAEAYRRGSPDNLTVQIVRIDALPEGDAGECLGSGADLPLPPLLEPRRCSTATGSCATSMAAAAATSISRSTARATRRVALKIPSIDLRDDPAYLKRFMMEEWVARRINSAACAQAAAADAQAQLPLCRHRVRRRPDAARNG